ncbi:MAG: hypothetical protein PHE50_02325 [Dehalococcoidales bacterium]|nr:hypothetical protein [Dehalococcoidales bacterium]
MRLNDEQKKILVEKLALYWTDKKCTCCDNNNWVVSDTVFELREFFSGSIVLGGNNSIVPVIVATCTKCGYIKFFNAIPLGLISLSKEKTSEETKGVIKSD